MKLHKWGKWGRIFLGYNDELDVYEFSFGLGRRHERGVNGLYARPFDFAAYWLRRPYWWRIRLSPLKVRLRIASDRNRGAEL